MGFKDWLKEQAAQAPVASYHNFVLRKDSIERVKGEDKGQHPLKGATASVETAEELQKRVTATRLLTTGVFAFALKKKTGGTSYLTIEGSGFAWVVEIERKGREDAVKFAAKVRGQAAAAE